MWDLIVSVPDHCLSFYFTRMFRNLDLSATLFPNKWGMYALFHLT